MLKKTMFAKKFIYVHSLRFLILFVLLFPNMPHGENKEAYYYFQPHLHQAYRLLPVLCGKFEPHTEKKVYVTLTKFSHYGQRFFCPVAEKTNENEAPVFRRNNQKTYYGLSLRSASEYASSGSLFEYVDFIYDHLDDALQACLWYERIATFQFRENVPLVMTREKIELYGKARLKHIVKGLAFSSKELDRIRKFEEQYNRFIADSDKLIYNETRLCCSIDYSKVKWEMSSHGGGYPQIEVYTDQCGKIPSVLGYSPQKGGHQWHLCCIDEIGVVISSEKQRAGGSADPPNPHEDAMFVPSRAELLYAIWQGHEEKAVGLADHNRISQCDGFGVSPLHYAARRNMCRLIRRLTEQGADINCVALGWTPLHEAAARGHIAAVRLLLESGARKDIPQGGATPYDVAVQSGHDECAKLLGTPNESANKEMRSTDLERMMPCVKMEGQK